MHRRFLTAAVVLIAALPLPAGAAAEVSVTGTSRSGDILTVSGGSSFVDQPFVTVGTDPIGDAPTGFGLGGGDLSAVKLRTTADGDVKLRFEWPNGTSGAMPPYAYGWTFCVDGMVSCFELHMQRFTYGAHNGLPTAGDSVLYRCATSACAASGRTAVDTGWIPIYFDGLGFTATLPGAIGAAAGSTITSIPVDSAGAAYNALGQAEPATVQAGTGDGVQNLAGYRVAVREVSVGVGEAGLDPASVVYATTVTPDGIGDWTASVDVNGQSGERQIYVRACLGAGNCAYAARSVSL